MKNQERERERREWGLLGDLAGSICLCLSSSGRDVRNMQRRAVIIICAPHRRGPPCALEYGDTPRGAAPVADPVASEDGSTVAENLLKGEKRCQPFRR